MQETIQNKIVLGVYLKEPSANIKNILNELGAVEYEQGYIFPFKEEELSTYEDLDQGVGDISLGGVDEETAEFYPSQKLTDLFISDQEIEPSELDLSFIPDIGDFIDENQSEVQNILNGIADTKNTSQIENEKGNDKEKYNKVEQIQTENTEENDYSDKEAPFENTIEKKSVITDQEDKSAITEAQRPVDHYIPQGKVDPLLTLAADIFENNVEATLPIFDEYTSTQLRPHIVKSEMTVHNARDKTIFAIYNTIKEHRGDVTREFKNNFSKYTQEHSQTIKKIEKKAQDDMSKAKTDAQYKYKKAQDEFVVAQEQTLRNNYDSEHEKEYLTTLQLKLDEIKKNAQKDIDVENHLYQSALNEEQVRYLERRFRQLDYTEVINNFNEIVAKENQTLLEESRAFKDQVGALTAKLATERDQLKKDVETEKRARKIFEDTMTTQIDMEAKRQAEQLSINLKKERDEALNTASEQNALNQKTITSLTDSLNSEREKNAILTQQLQDMSKKNNKTNVDLTQVTSPNNKEKRSGVVGIIMSTVLVMISVAGLAFGGYILINDNSNKNTETTQRSIQGATSTSHYSSGDKWSYKASDGKTYEVTMDGPSTGTYKDDEGNTHKIELN